MRNILLKISYDGTNFSGWQRQPKRRTVQGEIEKTLSDLCREEIQICGTSRTDAGVHAYGQQANFMTETPIPVDRIKIAVNNWLPEDIRIKEVSEMPLDFHARYAAKRKKYIYKIKNYPDDNVFLRNYCYNVQKCLDISAMRHAKSYLVGTHDFRSFMAAGGQERENTVRTIYSLKLICNQVDTMMDMISGDCKENNTDSKVTSIYLEVTGNGFLYNMVRIIAGTLVDIGTGKLKPEHIPEIIASQSRQKSGHTAPPQGLYLSEVYF